MILLRSLLFNAAFFLATAVLAVLALPLLAAPRGAIMWVTRVWARVVIGLLHAICGVRLELRGLERIPPGAVVLAAKHQSAFDTIVWLALLPDTAYVLKKELLSIPFYGWHARKAGMIPVDRAGGGAALRAMLRAAQAALAEGRQVVIFPEGTRTAPGQRVPYQPGVVAIAAGSEAPVIPVATDSGRVWGRRSFLKRPGVIRVSVLEALPHGLPRARLLAALEAAIETETDRLLAEGGRSCG
ncbi:1-acyl-sn-glycerol-3-phosphate acyltransferase [Planktothrix agardhii 1811]|uniref:lysophospholipid acyltransferase family protein n=1 Tax=Planktothrix agardhii TaxID=1160 RepID=UPI001F3B3EC4|nr:lysophospholipid acyltransferase family protein [Planktothrix agardhii]MCF3580048.1 1-acyl-sn-glycerol-3-phosphate acyltransferase [Planktothrix agardhii 1811]